MLTSATVGALLALVSGVMNGLFTFPMRLLGRWAWENVWTVFITGACLLLPAVMLFGSAPHGWAILAHAPRAAVLVAIVAGFAWGFGAIMFGQSVSAIGIALANTLVLAISSALGSLLPMLLLTPEKLHERSGHALLVAIAVELAGIALCGRAGSLREKESASVASEQRGDLVGKARPLSVALLLTVGSGILSAVFNIGFALAVPISDFGKQQGLSAFASTNLIWTLMLGSGAISNLGFCAVLLLRNRTAPKFLQPGMGRLAGLGMLMALLWGGSIFVYGAAATRLGALGPSIGWPLSLAAGLVVANVVGFSTGEWKGAPAAALRWLFGGLVLLLFAIVLLSRAN